MRTGRAITLGQVASTDGSSAQRPIWSPSAALRKIPVALVPIVGRQDLSQT